MSRYLPAAVAFALSTPAWPIYLRALVGVGLAFYLALGVQSKHSKRT